MRQYALAIFPKICYTLSKAITCIIKRKDLMMKYFKIKFQNESQKIVKAKNVLEVIKKYDLATRKHIFTKIIELGTVPKNLENELI